MSATIDNDGFEETDFPVVCESCLGENPYVRMSKIPRGKQCKICTRPFTVFKWSPGRNKRFKKTDVCQTCAKLKNICQSCVLDLDLKISIAIRDKALNMTTFIPAEKQGREFYMNSVDKNLKGKVDTSSIREGVKRFAEQSEIFQKRLKTDSETFEAEFKKERVQTDGVKSLYLLKLGKDVGEEDLRVYFEVFGEIRDVVLVKGKNSAFVHFVERKSAEDAHKSSRYGINLKGSLVEVRWAKPKVSASLEVANEGDAGSSSGNAAVVTDEKEEATETKPGEETQETFITATDNN